MGTLSGNFLEDTVHDLWGASSGNPPADTAENPLEAGHEHTTEDMPEDVESNVPETIQEDALGDILEGGTSEVPGNAADYTQPLNDILSFMVLTIFFIGVISGIVLGNTMWRRIRE